MRQRKQSEAAMKRSSNHLDLFAVAALMSLSMACATVPTALEQARENYHQMQRDPQVSDRAPVASYEASQALRRTEQAWEESGDEDEVKHLAYLTNKRVEIARETARQKASEAEALQLKQEREKVLLQTRTREAEQAKQLAESRAREVQIAQQEAEARARESQEAQRQARTATDRAAELEKRFAELKAKQTDRGFELTLSDVLFEFDKANLKAGSARNLTSITEFLRENPQRQITVEGYTDNVGSDAYNLELSQRRAEAVRDFFVQNGISADRINARGLGEEYPVASNETQAGRQENRRVQIIIVNENGRSARQ
jgi:outer membrane protein OmpA-like peptidoglycan-associated protein